jgi:hypothetical protein
LRKKKSASYVSADFGVDGARIDGEEQQQKQIGNFDKHQTQH